MAPAMKPSNRVIGTRSKSRSKSPPRKKAQPAQQQLKSAVRLPTLSPPPRSSSEEISERERARKFDERPKSKKEKARDEAEMAKNAELKKADKERLMKCKSARTPTPTPPLPAKKGKTAAATKKGVEQKVTKPAKNKESTKGDKTTSGRVTKKTTAAKKKDKDTLSEEEEKNAKNHQTSLTKLIN